MTRTKTIATVIASLVAIIAIAPSTHGTGPGDGEGQRTGLVVKAQELESAHGYYSSGSEYVQEVYASQGIEIGENLGQDSYIIEDESPGDVVLGAGYEAILVDDTTAVGVPSEGGQVQVYRVTSEDVRRVDW